MALKHVMYILHYDNPTHPFAESSIRVRHFPTRDALDKEIEYLGKDSEIRIRKAVKQTTVTTRETIIDNS